MLHLALPLPSPALGLFGAHEASTLRAIARESGLASIALDGSQLHLRASTQEQLQTASDLVAERIRRARELDRIKTGAVEQRRIGISVHAVGLVLGRLGANIRRLRDAFNLERAEVHEGLRPGFSESDAVDSHRKHVLLVGAPANIDRAVAELEQLLRAVRPVDVEHGFLIRLPVPAHVELSDVHRLIDRLKQTAGVKSAGLGQNDELAAEFWLRGTKSAVQSAERAVKSLFQRERGPILRVAVVAPPKALLAMQRTGATSKLVLDRLTTSGSPLSSPPTSEAEFYIGSPSSTTSVSSDIAPFATSRQQHAALLAHALIDGRRLTASLGVQAWSPCSRSILAGEPTFLLDLMASVPLTLDASTSSDPTAVSPIFRRALPIDIAPSAASILRVHGYTQSERSTITLSLPMADGNIVTYAACDLESFLADQHGIFTLQTVTSVGPSPSVRVHLVRPQASGFVALDIVVEASAQPPRSRPAPAALDQVHVSIDSHAGFTVQSITSTSLSIASQSSLSINTTFSHRYGGPLAVKLSEVRHYDHTEHCSIDVDLAVSSAEHIDASFDALLALAAMLS